MKSLTHLFSRSLFTLMSLLILSLGISVVPTQVAAAACVLTVNTTPLYPSGSGGDSELAVTPGSGSDANCSWTPSFRPAGNSIDSLNR